MTLSLEADVELDHLVVACQTPEQGEAWLHALAGVAPAGGGSHPGWGTHNRVLRLDARTYLELVAADPSQPAPALPRPFGLDDPVDAQAATRRWTGSRRMQPTRIEWQGGARPVRHPTDALAASGVTLRSLRIAD